MNLLMNITNLQNEYLKNINLKLYENNIVVIMGKSGIGKTTLLKSILGFEKYEGIIDTESPMGYVPQNLALFENKSIFYNLKVADEDIDKIKVKELLVKVNLKKSIFCKISNLSQGQKQRIAFLRALLGNKKIILMDEALTGLDYETKNQIIEFIKKFKKEIGIIYVTHDIYEAYTLSDEVYYMDGNMKKVKKGNNIWEFEKNIKKMVN